MGITVAPALASPEVGTDEEERIGGRRAAVLAVMVSAKYGVTSLGIASSALGSASDGCKAEADSSLRRVSFVLSTAWACSCSDCAGGNDDEAEVDWLTCSGTAVTLIRRRTACREQGTLCLRLDAGNNRARNLWCSLVELAPARLAGPDLEVVLFM